MYAIFIWVDTEVYIC